MKTTLLNGIVCAIVIGIAPAMVLAQDQVPAHKHLAKEDSAAVNALVMYPDSIRLHIFEVCEYPSAIVSIASLQKNSSDEFVTLIGTYSKEEQEDFWNLSRYPGLISRLVQEGKESVDQINAVLKDYPAEIHETALKYGMGYYPVLEKMDGIQNKTDSDFDQILNDYPPETQEALRVIIQYPEIINLLNDHLSLTVRVGDRYRRNPQGVIRKADSLNLVETRQNAADAEAWKDSVEQNPQEASDLQSAAADYATENGYTKEEVEAAPDPDYVQNYTCNPYPYWFGYPTWYPYSYWYPYPYWFDCGFYHDRYGRIVVIGSPSRYFTNWYFYYPEHLHRYPNLANGYIDHYGGRQRSGSGNSVIVHAWIREHRDYLPKDFVANRRERPEVIRQAGRLDVDVQKQAGGKQVTPALRDDYLRRNTSKFPSLNNEPRKRTPIDEGRQNTPNVIEPPARQPAIRITMPVHEAVTNPREPATRPIDEHNFKPEPAKQQPIRIVKPAPQTTFTPRQPATSPGYNFNTIHKAQEYQRNVWEETQPTVRPQPQPAAPRPQMAQPRPQMAQPRPQPQPVRQSPGPVNRSKQK
ncbi:MAG: hypothetical protein WBZ48_13715 [Bacteroidota bacterium]